jgi:histidine triad (HIT) family protein
VTYDRNNIFAKILRGELPAKKVYEDEFALAFHDIRPLTPVHVLVIPKGEYVSFIDFAAAAPADFAAGFWRAVGTTARQLGLDESGYRIVANSGADAHQIVFHFHVHIFAGRPLSQRMGNMPQANEAS